MSGERIGKRKGEIVIVILNICIKREEKGNERIVGKSIWILVNPLSKERIREKDE